MPSTKNRAPGANARPCPEGRSTECRRDSPAAVAGRQQILHFDLSQTAEISTFRPRLSLPISARLRNFHYSFGTHHRPGGVQGYRVGAPSSARSRRRHDVATAGKVQIMPSKAGGPRRTASPISPTSDALRGRNCTDRLRAHVGRWSAKGVRIGADLCPWRQLEVRKSTPRCAKADTRRQSRRRSGLLGTTKIVPCRYYAAPGKAAREQILRCDLSQNAGGRPSFSAAVRTSGNGVPTKIVPCRYYAATTNTHSNAEISAKSG